MTNPVRSQSRREPIIYARLMDAACNQPRHDIEQQLVTSARDSAQAISSPLWKAYQEGVRDGFVQGVAAAEDVEPTTQEEREEHLMNEARIGRERA